MTTLKLTSHSTYYHDKKQTVEQIILMAGVELIKKPIKDHNWLRDQAKLDDRPSTWEYL